MTQWGIDALFNPGKRHMDEEKRRLQATRQEIGDSSGGKRIDLSSGKVTLKGRPKPNATDADDTADAEDTQDAEDAEDAEDAQDAEDAEDIQDANELEEAAPQLDISPVPPADEE